MKKVIGGLVMVFGISLLFGLNTGQTILVLPIAILLIAVGFFAFTGDDK